MAARCDRRDAVRRAEARRLKARIPRLQDDQGQQDGFYVVPKTVADKLAFGASAK